ncbi:MAG: GGDEF domain-containing protein [Candidatus Daviesbacteria bacterium]|nr:GGDEF domain-containing protein [Candidatus Daviesbacteria bacterium]
MTESQTEDGNRIDDQNNEGLDLSNPEIQELLKENSVVARIITANGQLFEQFRPQVDPRKLDEAKYRSALQIIEAMGLDPLIEGLYNKRGFDDQLGREIERARRNNAPLSLIVLDADGFKLINDTCGHLEGDRTIAVMGRRIKESIRMNDIGAHWGGDEFGIVLPDTTSEEALAVAFRVLNIIPSAAPDFATLTASIGVTRFMEGDNAQSLFERADKGQKAAKEFGKDQIVGIGLGIPVDDLSKEIQGRITLL